MYKWRFVPKEEAPPGPNVVHAGVFYKQDVPPGPRSAVLYRRRRRILFIASQVSIQFAGPGGASFSTISKRGPSGICRKLRPVSPGCSGRTFEPLIANG